VNALQPPASAAELRRRAALYTEIRTFFAERGVLEVQTPVLSPYAVTDMHIESWRTVDPVRYLRTSPEYAMKKLLAAGSRDIYELGPVFRLGEQGQWHSPEFTMLEWYRVGWGYHELADEVVALLQTVADGALAEWRVNKLSYRELCRLATGVDPLCASTPNLQRAAANAGLSATENLLESQLLDFVFSHCVQPCLDKGQIHIVHDFPESQAALAQIDHEVQPPIAQRFEVFIGALELANGYQELTDAEEQRQRFEADNAARRTLGRPQLPIDTQLLQALAADMPEASGVSIGIDRLLVCLAEALSEPQS